jgi:TetR/AcrR family transcriptional repressor of nem operon
MKYPKEYKAGVNQRLRNHASSMIREKGLNSLSVKSVMDEEDMTVGGFYSHFKSKDDLVMKAVETAFDQSNSTYYDSLDHLSDREWLKVAITSYLSQPHRDNPASGCPVASLLSEIPRAADDTQAAFERGLKAMLSRYEERLTRRGDKDVPNKTIALFALMSGGIQLARAVPDEAYSNQIIEACLNGAESLIKPNRRVKGE